MEWFISLLVIVVAAILMFRGSTPITAGGAGLRPTPTTPATTRPAWLERWLAWVPERVRDYWRERSYLTIGWTVGFPIAVLLGLIGLKNAFPNWWAQYVAAGGPGIFSLFVWSVAVGLISSFPLSTNKRVALSIIAAGAIYLGFFWTLFVRAPFVDLREVAITGGTPCEERPELQLDAVGMAECIVKENEQIDKAEAVQKVLEASGRRFASAEAEVPYHTPPAPAPYVEPVRYEEGTCPYDKEPGKKQRITLRSTWEANPVFNIEGCDVTYQSDGPIELTDGDITWDYDPSAAEPGFVNRAPRAARSTNGRSVTFWYLRCDEGYGPKPRADGTIPWTCDSKEVRVAGAGGGYYEAGVTTGIKLNLGVYRQR